MLSLACVLFSAGCRSTPPYTGEGNISNTTSWEDNIARVRSYTVRLPPFALNENKQGKFRIGDVAFFRKTTLRVTLRFADNHNWWNFSALPASMKTPEYVAEGSIRDIDSIEGRLRFQLTNSAGKTLVLSDKPLRAFKWTGGGKAKDGWHEAELYDPDNPLVDTSEGDDLKLGFSYFGDKSLTNWGYLVLQVFPK